MRLAARAASLVELGFQEGPAAADAQCLRATRSATPPTGSGPVLEGRVPDEIPRRSRGTRSTAGRSGSRAGRDERRHARQAPVPALRGRPRAALAPGDDGAWRVSPRRRGVGRRAWLVTPRGDRRGRRVRRADARAADRRARARFDQRLAGARPRRAGGRVRRRAVPARGCAPTTRRAPIGDALLDQRTVAGIGNIWKAEGCWEAAIDPWRPVARGRQTPRRWRSSTAVRPRMLRSARGGSASDRAARVRRAGRPCPRCGDAIRAAGQGDANRTTYWCPGCQRSPEPRDAELHCDGSGTRAPT